MDEHTIDLSSHPDPAGFVKGVEGNYPDENVSVSLEGSSMRVVVDHKVPLQLRVNIFSFLTERAKEGMSS